MKQIQHATRKAVIVEVIGPKDREIREEAFEEFRLLVETLGIEIVAETSQVIKDINYAFFIGKGKLEEIKQIVKLLEADFVFIDATLTYLQLRNLSKEIEVPCIDRPHLIIMIFSMRAKSSEGKLQVELTQLKMRLPEIVHNEINLDQQTGSEMGLKGPGERRTELKRRYIDNRIKSLETHLKEIKKHREERRKRRKKSNIPIVAIAGYTNSGKSTLLNVLTGADSYVENMLFATLDTLIRETEISEGFRVLFTDTIGFIRDLPPALIYAFHSTLEEILDSWLILHVVDSSDENFRKKIEVVEETLKELGCEDIPQLLVFNKMDKLSPDSANFIKNAYKEAVFISALRKEGLEDLKKKIHEILEKSLIKVKLFIPYEAGSILSQIYDLTNVIWKQDEENGTTLYIEGLLDNVNKFKDYFVFN